MTKLATIISNLDVTPEQVGSAHLVLSSAGNFYQVESAHSYDQYDVRYSKEHGFTCTCQSGMHGFSNVRHASGVCWHVRAAVACSMEVKSALKEQERLQAAAREHVLIIAGQQADEATYERVMASKGAPVKRGSSLPQSRPFQLMR